MIQITGRDLDAKIPGAWNFEYWEFVKSDTAIRNGIVNQPTESDWRRVEHLAKEVIQPVRSEFGRIKILSGFRNVALCIALGSSAKSYHAFGGAADIEPFDRSVTLFEVLEWIYDNIEFNELIAEYFPWGWVHVGKIEGDERRILKLKDPNHNYKEVSIQYLRNLYG